MLTSSGSYLLQPAQSTPVAHPILNSTPATQVTPSPTPAPQASTQAQLSLVFQEWSSVCIFPDQLSNYNPYAFFVLVLQCPQEHYVYFRQGDR